MSIIEELGEAKGIIARLIITAEDVLQAIEDDNLCEVDDLVIAIKKAKRFIGERTPV